MNAGKLLTGFFEIILLFSAFLLTNLTASVIVQFPDLSGQNWIAWARIVVSIIIFLVLQITLRSLWRPYLKAWEKQASLVAFLIYCFLTLIWTEYFEASVYELSLMLLATLLGVYISVRYAPREVINLLRYFGIFCTAASFLLLLFYPSLAQLNNPEYNGAWRGIFWHRNHLGSLMAYFSMLFLLRLMMVRNDRLQFIFNTAFFILSTVLVVGSRSATGILIYFLLNGTLIMTFLWLKLRRRLLRKHYLAILITGGIAVVLSFLNLNFIFGLLGRESTLTGRVPLWTDLISRVWAQKPVFGYGFGALWNREEFRVSMQLRHGWAYPVLFSDNGYLDILLNTGLIGLLLFLAFFVVTGACCGKAFFKNTDLVSLFPLLTFVYVLLANISYSFLFELDQFVWMLLVIAAVLSASTLSGKPFPAGKLHLDAP